MRHDGAPPLVGGNNARSSLREAELLDLGHVKTGMCVQHGAESTKMACNRWIYLPWIAMDPRISVTQMLRCIQRLGRTCLGFSNVFTVVWPRLKRPPERMALDTLNCLVVSQFHMMLTHFQVDHTSGSRGWVESTRPCFEETSAEIVKQIQLDMSRQHDDLGQTHSRPPTDQMLGWGFHQQNM